MAIINCYDVNGNAIRFLTQWDHDISIRTTGVKTSPIPEFRFSNKHSQKSKCIGGVVVGDGVKATIPNGFLQEALPIYVQLFYTYPSGDAKTEHTFVIPVKPASMPDGAVYEPVEVRSIAELEKRIKALEENGVPGAGGVPSNPGFDTVSLGGDAGVVIIPEGTADAPAITFYGAHGDEPVALNNVADATDDRSAPNLGQVKRLVEEHSGQTLTLDNTLTQSGQAADAKTTGDEIRRVEGLIPSIEGLAKTKDVPTKPEDIGAQPAGHYLTEAPVKSVNGKTGDVEFNASDVKGVAYIAQELTEEQQTQARHNIGAVSMEEVEALIGGEDVGFSETGEIIELELEPNTPVEVVSKIHRDSTWNLSNKLVLHQVSGNNFVDFAAYLGGAGTTYTKNGMTVVVNDNSTVTIRGVNDSASSVSVINKTYWDGEHSEKVYPAGTYTIPTGFTFGIRAAQYPKNVAITGATGNLSGTVTIPEPFRIVTFIYTVKGGATVDVTLPLGLYYGNSVPETGFEYSGILHTATFGDAVYDGEFNWTTGELKDAEGNTTAYYDSHEIKSLPGTNYFWTCFGENTASNVSNELGKVILRLNESAPEETVPSICDFMLTPTTMTAAYGLYRTHFMPDGEFYGTEVPVLTTKGVLSVKDVEGNVKYSKYIEPIFNYRGAADVLTHAGLEKKWSKKFYLTKPPVTITTVPAPYTGAIDNDVFVWEFDESEFANTGIPAKIRDIPVASPCFINNELSENRINGDVVWNGDPYPAFFSYDAETDKYMFTARGLNGNSIIHQLTTYSKVHFYYQLETPYSVPFSFAMGIDSGDKISFEADLMDAQPYIDNGHIYMLSGAEVNVDPTVTVFVPRNVEDAMDGMNNAARMLNADHVTGGDATVQGYSWIGVGDGVTDYTIQIQSKLDELHNVTKGGTIHLGPGIYPISDSLIVHGDTQIVGDGDTIIEQRSDNVHAVVWNGSRIRMRDLTIKLAGACTEITSCIYTNNNNITSGTRDERYPENTYVQYCSLHNVTLSGTYNFSWDDAGVFLSDEALTYRGVGIGSVSGLYFNYHDCDGLICKHLYAGVYGGGSANIYRVYVTESRYAVYGGGANNIFNITGHTHYGYGREGRVLGTDYAFYGTITDNNTITVAWYDPQFSKGVIYFEGRSQNNRYTIVPSTTALSNGVSTFWDERGFARVTDYGRGNIEIQPYQERFVGVGSALYSISGLPYWNTQFNPSIHNALSGAGLWGVITSNCDWSYNGITLLDVCRYPKDTNKNNFGLASVVSSIAPSEDAPIEITIDISNRPITSYAGFWIQFNHKYVAENYTVGFDTTNDGTFDLVSSKTGNNQAVSYGFNYQLPSTTIYRIKISITKALQVSDFAYHDAGYGEHIVDYNPEGLVGIVNIGMPSDEVYGRAFLGECGGNIYGNVDMHQNTLKNLPAPVDDGDAVSKSYLEEKVSRLSEVFAVDDGAGNVTLTIGSA